MEYLIFAFLGIVFGIGLSGVMILEFDRKSEFENKKVLKPEKIYAPELEPLREGYEYTGYYVLCNDEWYPVIRKVKDNE